MGGKRPKIRYFYGCGAWRATLPCLTMGSRRTTLRTFACTLATIVVLFTTAAPPARAQPTTSGAANAPFSIPAGFQETVALAGLDHPMAVEFAADGRIFVAEKRGVIKVFDSLTDTTPTIFADLRTQVYNFWDRGLNGMALHPNFPATPYIYVLYTRDAPIGGTAPVWGTPNTDSDPCPGVPGATADGCVASGRLSRLQAAGDVMTGAEVPLVTDWCQQFPSHTLDTLRFGPDGALYASAGEAANFNNHDYGQWGGSAGSPTQRNPCGDPPGGVGGAMTLPSAQGGSLRSQDVRTAGDPTGLDGTIIRVDPLTGLAAAGNPSTGPDENARRIVAHGFRNPFRFTFRPGTSEIWVGDVGDVRWDELNRIIDPAGSLKNFGWPCYEGAAKHPGWDSLNATLCESLYATPAVVAPYYAYAHDASVVAGDGCPVGGASSSGVAFYQGGPYPAAYDNALFFSDYTRRCIWVMRAGANGLPDPATRSLFIGGAQAPVDLRIGPGGDLFYLDYLGGNIRRISYFGADQPPVAQADATPTSGPVPLAVSFTGTRSTDPEGGALSYAWDLDGDGAYDDSVLAAPSRTYTVAATTTVRLRVTDPAGNTATDAVVITAGDTGPTAVIDAPDGGMPWRAGQTIAFSGHATDPDQGTLPATSLDWSLVLQHCATPSNCHAHPIQDYPGVASGTFVAPSHELPAYLELRLTATDNAGLQSTVTRRLDPETVLLSFASSPSGLALSVGTETSATPFEREVIRDSSVAVSAPTPQSLGAQTYAFQSWSDAGADSHVVVASAASSYTANYTASTTQTYAADTFTRNVVNGWGSAETGGVYSLSGAVADFDVNGTTGTITHAVGVTRAATLDAAIARDVDLTLKIRTDKVASGDGMYIWLVGRRTANGQSEYRSRLRLLPNGSVLIRTMRVVGGVQTLLGSDVQVAGLTHPGTALRARVQWDGAAPTTIRMRVWADGTAEPGTWQSVVTDASAALQPAGAIGVRSYLASNATNAPVVLSVDDLRATSLVVAAGTASTYAADTFSRTIANSWGSADTGGAYEHFGALADYDTLGSAATIAHPAGTTRAAMLRSVSAVDVDLTFTVRSDKLPTGDGITIYGVGRSVGGGTSEYRPRIRLAPGGGVWLRAVRYLSGAQSALGTDVQVPGLSYTPDARLRVRVQLAGASPTTIRIKVWADGTAEPPGWQSVVTDASAPLQGPGAIGVRSFVALNSTNAPILLTFDDLLARSIIP